MRRQGNRLLIAALIICPLSFAYFSWLLFKPRYLRVQEKTISLSAAKGKALFDSWLVLAKTKKNCHILFILFTTSDYLPLETGFSPLQQHSTPSTCEQYPGRCRGGAAVVWLFISAALLFVYKSRSPHIVIIEYHFYEVHFFFFCLSHPTVLVFAAWHSVYSYIFSLLLSVT